MTTTATRRTGRGLRAAVLAAMAWVPAVAGMLWPSSWAGRPADLRAAPPVAAPGFGPGAGPGAGAGASAAPGAVGGPALPKPAAPKTTTKPAVGKTPAVKTNAPVNRGQRVMTAGHSFHVPHAAALRDLCAAAGIRDHRLVDTQFIGGSTVGQHWDLPDARNKAKSRVKAGEADVLTLSPYIEPSPDALRNFTELMIKANPQGRVTMQISWMPFEGEFLNMDAKAIAAKRQTATADSLKEMHAEAFGIADSWIKEINDKAGKPVLFAVPVAQAVIALRGRIAEGKAPGLRHQHDDLFTDAIGHGKAPITLLTAYCHFAVIYRRSPVGMPLPAAMSRDVSPQLNKLLQELAWEAVLAHPLAGVAADKADDAAKK